MGASGRIDSAPASGRFESSIRASLRKRAQYSLLMRLTLREAVSLLLYSNRIAGRQGSRVLHHVRDAAVLPLHGGHREPRLQDHNDLVYNFGGCNPQDLEVIGAYG